MDALFERDEVLRLAETTLHEAHKNVIVRVGRRRSLIEKLTAQCRELRPDLER